MTENDLYALVEQWEMLADEAREQTRLLTASDISRVSFYQGVMKTYLSAAADLRNLLLGAAAPDETPKQYASVSEAVAQAALQKAGLFARTLTLHSDHVFTAVFSRLQPITQERRIEALAAADARIVIVDQGMLRDTGDPFIDFAFKPE